MIEQDSLLEVIADGLEVDVSDISIDTKASDIEDWDSLGHLNLLMKLDEAFGDISEKVPELASASSVKEIYELVSAYKS